jgi:hypothetical protein
MREGLASRDYQHIKHDHRRQEDDHRPDAECPQNVFGGKALLFRDWIPLVIHDAPAFPVVGTLIRKRL